MYITQRFQGEKFDVLMIIDREDTLLAIGHPGCVSEADMLLLDNGLNNEQVVGQLFEDAKAWVDSEEFENACPRPWSSMDKLSLQELDSIVDSFHSFSLSGIAQKKAIEEAEELEILRALPHVGLF